MNIATLARKAIDTTEPVATRHFTTAVYHAYKVDGHWVNVGFSKISHARPFVVGFDHENVIPNVDVV